MKMNANIDYENQPHAIVEYLGETADIYPFLSDQVKKQINRSYECTLEISVSQDAVRKALPGAWKLILQAKRVARKLPAHIKNAMLNVPDYEFPKPEFDLVIIDELQAADEAEEQAITIQEAGIVECETAYEDDSDLLSGMSKAEKFEHFLKGLA